MSIHRKPAAHFTCGDDTAPCYGPHPRCAWCGWVLHDGERGACLDVLLCRHCVAEAAEPGKP